MAKSKKQVVTTTSNKKVEPITFEDLLLTMERFKDIKKVPKSIKVAPDVHDYINDFFIDRKAEAKARKLAKPGEKLEPWTVAAVWGVDVIVDDTMQPGQWKVEEAKK